MEIISLLAKMMIFIKSAARESILKTVHHVNIISQVVKDHIKQCHLYPDLLSELSYIKRELLRGSDILAAQAGQEEVMNFYYLIRQSQSQEEYQKPKYLRPSQLAVEMAQILN
jgi:hypothetical protein